MLLAVTTSMTSASSFSPELYALTVSAIIGAVIAVFTTFAVQNYLDKPKIKSSLLQVIASNLTDPEVGITRPIASFFCYVYVTNLHKNAIYVLDYELQLDFGEGYKKITRLYGLKKVAMPFEWNLRGTSRKMRIANLANELIYKEPKPVQFGDFIHGFVCFYDQDLTLLSKEIIRIQFTCIDVMRKRHTIETSPKSFVDASLFFEIVDATEVF